MRIATSRERARQETQILQEPAPAGKGIRRRVRNRLIVMRPP